MSRAKRNPQIPLHYVDDDDDEEVDDSPAGDPCPHCDSFLVVYGDDNDPVCPNCHLTPDGTLDTPSRRDTSDGRNYIYYRKSEKAVLYGAVPAYVGDDEYGLDDNSADYDAFLSG